MRKWSESHSVMYDSLWPRGLYSPWNSPGQNTGEGSLSSLQQIILTQESNQGFLHCRRTLYQLSYQGRQWMRKWLLINRNGGWEKIQREEVSLIFSQTFFYLFCFPSSFGIWSTCCVKARGTASGLDMYIYCKMTTTGSWANNHHLIWLQKIQFSVMRTFSIYPYSNFQIHHTAFLVTVIMLYVIAPMLIYLIAGNLNTLPSSPCILEELLALHSLILGVRDCWGTRWGGGLSLPYRRLQQQDWTFCVLAPERRTKLWLQCTKQLQERETYFAQRLMWLWGLAMLPGVREWTPSLRQYWTNHQGPQLQTLWGLWQTETKMSDAARMRNSVPRKHTLFNNLPQSEQKPAEIKPEAAKNAPLKSSRSTVRIGSGVELRVSFWQKGREGGPWQSVLETGNEGGERQALI